MKVIQHALFVTVLSGVSKVAVDAVEEADNAPAYIDRALYVAELIVDDECRDSTGNNNVVSSEPS